MTQRWIYALRGIILTGFAMYIMFLVQTDSLVYYIAPRMMIYVKLSAIGLYAAAAYQIYQALQPARKHGHAEGCGCDHHHTASKPLWKQFAMYGLFLLPLVLGFALPNKVLDSSMASKKGISFNAAQNIAGARSIDDQTGLDKLLPEEREEDTQRQQKQAADDDLQTSFPYDEYTEVYAKYAAKLIEQPIIQIPEDKYMETLTTLDLYSSAFQEKQIQISGFVFREDGMTSDSFGIGRFSISCCTADAAPYGMMVSYPRAVKFENDSWVQITGVLSKTSYMGNDIILLKAEQVERIEAPETPYIYANDSFEL